MIVWVHCKMRSVGESIPPRETVVGWGTILIVRPAAGVAEGVAGRSSLNRIAESVIELMQSPGWTLGPGGERKKTIYAAVEDNLEFEKPIA